MQAEAKLKRVRVELSRNCETASPESHARGEMLDVRSALRTAATWRMASSSSRLLSHGEQEILPVQPVEGLLREAVDHAMDVVRGQCWHQNLPRSFSIFSGVNGQSRTQMPDGIVDGRRNGRAPRRSR